MSGSRSITGGCRLVIQCSPDCPYKDKEYTLSKYRRDTHVGYGYSVPKSICKTFNRERRAKDKAEVNRIWRQEDYEEYEFNPWLKDAGWHYW
jgi:hypothetical protein